MVVGWVATLYLAGSVAGLRRRTVAAAMLVLSASALAGAHVHYALATATGAGWARWRTSGAHVAGGAFALVVALPIVTRRLGLPWRHMADVSAMAGFLALATYRIGCHVRGCCFGVPSDVPWAIRYGRSSTAFLAHADARLVPADAATSLPVHPLALYFASAAFTIAVAGRLRYPRRRYDGEVAVGSLAVFAASTIALETLRADLPGHSSRGLTVAAVVLLVVSLVVSIVLARGAHGRPAADR